MPFSAFSSGRISSSKPLFSKSKKPTEGLADCIILFNSERIRSCVIIFIRSLLAAMAAKVSVSIKKLNCVAKRIALSIRKGSSEKVTLGSSGVRITRLSKSRCPKKGSTSIPQVSLFSPIANALMVKSRRF